MVLLTLLALLLYLLLVVVVQGVRLLVGLLVAVERAAFYTVL
jgi:hypothetical protein